MNFLSNTLISSGQFLDRCEELKQKRELLDTVQKQLNLISNHYGELEHTQEVSEELKLKIENTIEIIKVYSTHKLNQFDKINGSKYGLRIVHIQLADIT